VTGFFITTEAHDAILQREDLSPAARAALTESVRGSAGPRRWRVAAAAEVLRELRKAFDVLAQQARLTGRPARARACADAVAAIDRALTRAQSAAAPAKKSAAETPRKDPRAMGRRGP
jgi:hypothetical protein